jgi:hypothetical protein
MWREFLRDWQEEVRYICTLLPDERYESEKDRLEAERIVLVRPPAPESSVGDAERRLGVALEGGLRSFYLESNGWYQYSFDAENLVVSSVEGIRFLKDCPKDFVGDVAEYFTGSDYGRDLAFIEKKYVNSALILSEINSDGCYLANRRNDGSWEYGIVFFESAPVLFNSFDDLMKSERNRCVNNLRALL